jgi:hypothetical protein
MSEQPRKTYWTRAKSVLHPGRDCFRLVTARGAHCLAVVDQDSAGNWLWYGIGRSSGNRTILTATEAMSEAQEYAMRQDREA